MCTAELCRWAEGGDMSREGPMVPELGCGYWLVGCLVCGVATEAREVVAGGASLLRELV